MARGPLPPGTESVSSPAGSGVMFYLNILWRATPPMARVALAQQVRAWAEKAEQDAMGEMTSREPFGSRAYDTTGQTRP
jgi:hypothetical protein